MNSSKRTCCVLVLVCYLVKFSLGQNEIGDLRNLPKANTIFATKLFKQLASNSSSFVFSPLSISIALSMLDYGAKGNTHNEMNLTLGFQSANLTESELLEGYRSLVPRLTGVHEGYEFALANGLFLHGGFPVYENYTRVLTEDFQAEKKLLDFSSMQQTVDEVNEWVKVKTNGKITNLLKELNEDDVMVLLNAVYFKGEWKTKFNEQLTHPFDFFTENGTRKLVRMMNDDVLCNFRQDHPIGGPVLELPYKGEVFSMFFLMPHRDRNLSSFVEGLTAESLEHISYHLSELNVTVGIPKIKIEAKCDLKTQLPLLGIRDVFSNSADLSGISSIPLKVSQAVHKAVLELTEEGAEAAAATAVVTMTRSGGFKPRFWANQPFVFFLRHNPTNTICFMGKVADV